jgi:hypothetical protein
LYLRKPRGPIDPGVNRNKGGILFSVSLSLTLNLPKPLFLLKRVLKKGFYFLSPFGKGSCIAELVGFENKSIPSGEVVLS